MNREIERSELARIVAEKEGIDQVTVDAFVNQLFKDVEKKMIDQSLVRLDNLGIFRIIKSGKTNRILFLGTSRKEEVKPQAQVNTNTFNTTNTPENTSTTATSPVKEDTQVSVRPRRIEKISLLGPSSVQEAEAKPDTDTKVSIPVEDTVQSVIEDKVVSENATPEKDVPKADNVKEQETVMSVPPVTMTQKDVEDSYTSRPPVYNRSRLKDKAGTQLFPKKETVFQRYKTLLRIAVVFIFVIALLAMFVMPQKDKEVVVDSGEQMSNTEFKFSELKNPDKQNLSCVIVAEISISLQQLSIIYYGDEKFWPYIYKANENIVANDYIIPSQSIIKIPRITVDLVELNAGKLDEKLNSLADDIAMN